MINSGLKDDDLISIVSKNQLLMGNSTSGRFLRRILSLIYVIKNKKPLKVFLFYMLPYRLVPEKHRSAVDSLLSDVIYASVFKNGKNKPNKLFGYNFIYPKTKNIKSEKLVLMSLALEISGIIIADQYAGHRFLKPDSIIIDAGANIGIFSLLASRLSPQGKIYAFEPNKDNYQFVKSFIGRNNINNIFLYNFALGDKARESKLLKIGANIDPLAGGSTLLDSNFRSGDKLIYNEEIMGQAEVVEVKTIDQFLESQKIDKLDFIKIDTEGYEKQIISGAKETIKRFSPVISCSAYHFKNDKIDIPKLVLSIKNSYQYELTNRAELDLIFWI